MRGKQRTFVEDMENRGGVGLCLERRVKRAGERRRERVAESRGVVERDEFVAGAELVGRVVVEAKLEIRGSGGRIGGSGRM